MTTSQPTVSPQPESQISAVYVWDPLVRIFHWSLVFAFLIAYFTDDEVMALHVWAGYATAGLILLRILWGLVGPKHARFTDFVCGPFKAWRYLIDLTAFRARRYLGHSPAGGVMVLLLMAGILATVWSGLEFYAAKEGKGPLAGALPAASIAVRAAENDSDEDGERRGDASARRNGRSIWGDAHETLANLMFLLVVVHIGGVTLASVAHRENLPRSMVTGWKRPE